MSFSIGLSALNAAQEEIAVTGNNIANASTNGFKASRAEFADVYAASVIGGDSRQGGGGVGLQAIAQNFTQGNITFTDNTLDLAINGGGFFILDGGEGQVFTRAGAFGTDKDGNIVNNAGEKLQGFPATAGGQAANGSGGVQNLVVSTADLAPKGTTLVKSGINLDAGAEPSSIIGTKVISNNGIAGGVQSGVRTAREAELTATISTAGTDFSGTTNAKTTGSANISAGLNFATAGGAQGFSISVNGDTFTAIDLSGLDTADADEVATHVRDQLALEPLLAAPNGVTVSVENNRLVLQTVAEGGNSRIAIRDVRGLASDIVTEGTVEVGNTAPPTGFSLTLGTATQDIVIQQDFTNEGSAAKALGGGSGSGNEALEDYIQAEIDSNVGLAGKVNVSINNLGEISFKAVEAGNSNLSIDPVYDVAGSVDFDQVVDFYTGRFEGTLNTDDFNFALNPTEFQITVGNAAPLVMAIDEDFTSTADLGSGDDASLEALEDFIQAKINASSLPGNVQVSIGSDRSIVFQLRDETERSLSVASTSEPARSIGTEDISSTGFDFATENYEFEVIFDDGSGAGARTSTLLTLNTNLTSGSDVVDQVNFLLRNDSAGLALDSVNPEVVARLDATTGQLIIETTATGGDASIIVNVSAPAILPASPIIGDTAGVAVNGSGPTRDFSAVASFTGSAINNTGANAATNGYVEETIEVTDAQGNRQLLTVAAGASASAVAVQFSSISGIAAKGTTVAYITATNRGDPSDAAFNNTANGGFVESNLPLKFTINGKTFEASADSNGGRLSELVSAINADTGSLSAVLTDDGALEITENNGADLVFGGGTDGRGSLTVVGAQLNSLTGDYEMSEDAGTQLADLSNRNNDALVVGGVVEFTLDEGVSLTDATRDANGLTIARVAESIFGDISEPETLAGTQFELNTFDPDNPNTYYRSTSIAVFDSLGKSHTLTQYFVKERAGPLDGNSNVWSVYFQIDGKDVGESPVSGDGSPSLAHASIRFNSSGVYESAQEAIYITNWDSGADPARPGQTSADDLSESSNFEIDLTQLTQFGGAFAVQSNTQDGYTKGQLTGLEINSAGVVNARFSNGQSQVIGEIALAKFADPSKLANIGGTRFAATSESGEVAISAATTGGRGAIQSGALEDSNVDLSEQLVQLIVSQRNFQAAAQIIESIDTSTQTIINL